MRNRITGIILSGGRGSRLGGGHKGLLDFAGQTLIRRKMDALIPLCAEIMVVTDDPPAYRAAIAAAATTNGINIGIRVIRDREGGVGPLMGLYSGLLQSGTEYNFVTACDMPFFCKELFLCLRAYIETGCDAVVSRIVNQQHKSEQENSSKQRTRYLNQYLYEPLFAFYSRACLPRIEESLREGRRRIASFFKRIEIVYVDEQEIRTHDSRLLSFMNINSPADLNAALKIVEKDRPSQARASRVKKSSRPLGKKFRQSRPKKLTP